MSALTKTKNKNYIKPTGADRVLDVVVNIILFVFAVLCLYPLWYTLIASFSNPAYTYSGQIWLWPKGTSFLAYEALFEEKEIWVGYRNSLVYTVLFCVFQLMLLIPTSWVMSRPRLRGSKLLFIFFLIPMYFSGGMVPSYVLMSQLGLVNNWWVMVIPQGVAAYYLIITRNYFQGNIPESVFESARMDGASVIQFLLRFVVPLSKPIVSVLVLYFGIGKWNDYTEPMIYIQDVNKQSLQVIIRNITKGLSEEQIDMMNPEQVAAATMRNQLLKYAVLVVASIPLLILYPVVQRYLIGGVMVGSVKE